MTLKNDKKECGYSEVNGISMYYEIYGSGSIPLVLIHGGGSTIQTSFDAILPFLSAFRQVIAVELQAHGRTGDRPHPVTFEQDADDVAGLLRNLDIPKASFLGFSNGGSTAMQIAIRHPVMVHKLIPISAVTKREGLIPGFFEFMATASLDNMPMPLQIAYREVAPDPECLQIMHDKDRDRMIHFTDWPDEDLRSISAPTLLIVGDRDVITVSHTLEMTRLIPDATLMVLPGVHGAMIGEICTASPKSRIPEYLAGMIEEFLTR